MDITSISSSLDYTIDYMEYNKCRVLDSIISNFEYCQIKSAKYISAGYRSLLIILRYIFTITCSLIR